MKFRGTGAKGVEKMGALVDVSALEPSPRPGTGEVLSEGLLRHREGRKREDSSGAGRS